MLRLGVAGQLKLNSLGTVSEIERLVVVGVGHNMAWRPRVAFCFISSFTSCRLAAMRNCSMSSVLKICLELLRLRWDNRDMRESQLPSILERTDGGQLKSISELIESRLVSNLRIRWGVIITLLMVRPNADRAGDDEVFLEFDRVEECGRGVPSITGPCEEPR